MRDSEESQKRLPSLHARNRRLNFRVRGQFESAAHKHDLFHMHFKKSELEPAIILKISTCLRIPSKIHSNSVGRYLSP